jgi:hypothetical protein
VPFARWVDAAAALAEFERPAGDAELDLAGRLGVQLTQRVPAVVARAMLHEQLDTLCGASPRALSEISISCGWLCPGDNGAAH